MMNRLLPFSIVFLKYQLDVLVHVFSQKRYIRTHQHIDLVEHIDQHLQTYL